MISLHSCDDGCRPNSFQLPLAWTDRQDLLTASPRLADYLCKRKGILQSSDFCSQGTKWSSLFSWRTFTFLLGRSERPTFPSGWLTPLASFWSLSCIRIPPRSTNSMQLLNWNTMSHLNRMRYSWPSAGRLFSSCQLPLWINEKLLPDS